MADGSVDRNGSSAIDHGKPWLDGCWVGLQRTCGQANSLHFKLDIGERLPCKRRGPKEEGGGEDHDQQGSENGQTTVDAAVFGPSANDTDEEHTRVHQPSRVICGHFEKQCWVDGARDSKENRRGEVLRSNGIVVLPP